MRLLLGVTLYFISLISVFSQDINVIEDWLDIVNTANTSFYKIEVREYGIYRISDTELNAIGYTTSNIDTAKIKMYRRGQEVAININYQNNNLEYIEFYGEPNDGVTDKYIYRNESDHKEFSEPIYSKTAVYFLSSPNINDLPNKRITEINENSSGAETVVYHWYTETYKDTPTVKSFNFRTSFSQGESVNRDRTSFSSAFRGPRSWTTYDTNKKTGIVSFQLRVNNLYTSISTNNNFRLESSIMNFAYNRRANVTFNLGNAAGNTSPKATKQISDYDEEEFSILLNQNDFANGSTHVLLEDSFNGTGSDNNQLGVLYFNLTYPQDHSSINNGTDLSFSIIADKKKRISAPQSSNSNFYNISDPFQPKVYRKINASNRDQAIIKQNNDEVNIYFSSSTKSVLSISKAEFELTKNWETVNYLIISHSELMKASTSHNNPVEAYANYRRGTIINEETNENYNVHVANINKLYNSFSWGEYTPQAIRNCINLLRPKNTSNGTLQYVFIIGKGLDLNYDAFETTPSGDRAYHYIPTYGYPGGDNTFTMGFDGTETGVLPVGRIAAHTPQVVEDYLNKVIEHENLTFDALWRKKALHLSGGANEYQQEEFKKIINRYGSVFMDTLEGGAVQTISRESDGSIEFIDVSDIVNEGISLMTFFGHSSAQSADIDIGYASDPTKGYANQGKYPFIMMSGCGGGNLFTHEKSWGEDWIETPSKGSIGFMAKSGLGSQFELENFGYDFYEATFQKKIGNQIGLHMIATHQSMLEGNPSFLRYSTIEQYGLQGDPAMKISPNKVDFSLSAFNIKVIPQNNLSDTPSSNDDFFKVEVTIDNFGKTSAKSDLYVQVRRRYGNGNLSRKILIDTIPSIYYSDVHTITYINSAEDKQNGGGNNDIIVTVGTQQNENGVIADPIEEDNKDNNEATVRVNFENNNISFLKPLDLSVVHNTVVHFYASDYSYNSKPETQRLLYLSTDSLFINSPSIRDLKGDQLIEYQVDLSKLNHITLTDTTIVYAKIGFEGSMDNADRISFTYIKNTSGNGWSQSNKSQMKSTTLTSINLKEDNNGNLTWTFPNNNKNISVKTGGASYGEGSFYEVEVNGEKYVTNGECKYNNGSLIFMIFDQESGEVITADAYWWNTRFCGIGYPSKASIQLQSQDLRRSGYQGNDPNNPLEPITKYGPYSLFVDPKTEYLKDGDYILAFSSGNFDFSTIPTNSTDLQAYNLNKEAMYFAGFDTTALYNLPKGIPFIGWTQYKSSSSEGQFIYGSASGDFLEEQFEVISNVTSGAIISPPIGKSTSFGRLWMNFSEINGQIKTIIKSVKFDQFGNPKTANLYTIDGEISDLGFDLLRIPGIDTCSYIQLETILLDTLNSTPTPSQLQNWRVSYVSPPEAVLTYENIKDYTNIPEIQQGESLEYNFKLKNISQVPFMDSISNKITYTTQNKEVNHFLKIPLLPPEGEYNFKIQPDTWADKLTGEVTLSISANSEFLPEIFYNNNSLGTKFNVSVDNTNPSIEVLFDGQRIISRDIISPNAEVSVSLIDDNQFLNLDEHFEEEDLISVFIKKPNDSLGFVPVDLQNIEIQKVGNQNHIIASFLLNESVNSNSINNTLDDGIYTLKVYGQDVTGNTIGKGSEETNNKRQGLAIDFEITNESSITNFYPYPNPFSDNVRFVFQLTGIEIPNQMKIQIMTVTGRVVKEIFQEELGPIRIGTNISEYAWDGKDEFGDQLANGVYLYRVIIPQKNEGDYKHRETSNDHLFKHNIGKLYLLR